MNIDQIMNRRVYTCSPVDSLNAAARLMWEHDCGAVPVVEKGGELVGIKASDTIEAAEHLMRTHQIRRLPVVDGGKMAEICKHRLAA